MRRSFVVLLTTLAPLVGVAPVSSACTCVPPSDFYSEYINSDAILLGEVIEISSAAPERPSDLWVTFRVESHWKGDLPAVTQLITANSSASCGYYFVVGTRYLVYANLGADLVLRASLCSRTHVALPGDPDLVLLDAGPTPPPHFALVMNPNPSRGDTRLTWTIPGQLGGQARTHLDVLDFQGRRLATLVDGPAAPGPHQSVWDGRDSRGRAMPAGVYWVRLACSQMMSRRLVRIAGP